MAWFPPTWPRRLSSPVVVAGATLGPIGRKLPAPGTWGSLAGLAYFAACFREGGLLLNLLASALGAYVAIGFCGEAEVRLGKKDPGEVILDEFVAIPLCFLGWVRLVPGWPEWSVLLAGFLLFRFFDILKPLGINRLQDFPGGLGVVIDDTAAAFATCASLHLLHLGGHFFWQRG